MNIFLSIWLRLTGGEQSCPRWRFALTMLVAYGLYHLLLQPFVQAAITLGQHGMPGGFTLPGSLVLISGLVLALVGLLLAFLPLSPLALLGVELILAEGYALLQGASAPATPVPPALWPYWVGFLAGAMVLLLAGSVAFGAAWRRLKDTGRSPLFLLLGLTYLLGFDNSGTYSAETAGVYLLGPLWLIILYSQPGKERAPFALFRPTR